MNTSRRLRKSITAYIERIGQTNPPLGEGVTHVPDLEDSRYLQSLLVEATKKNDILVWLAAGVLIVLFLACLMFVAVGAGRGNEMMSLIGGGGSVLSLIVFVAWLRQLWFDKSAMNFLLFSAANLPPAEAARLVTKFYFEARVSPLPPNGRARARTPDRHRSVATGRSTGD